MKLLKEDYGESNELDDFVYLGEKRFRTFYKVTLGRSDKLDEPKRYSNRYFFSEDAARDYYNKIKEDMESDRLYYEFADLTLSEVSVRFEEDELEDFSSAELDDEEDEEEIIVDDTIEEE